jgi:hypothetical protein
MKQSKNFRVTGRFIAMVIAVALLLTLVPMSVLAGNESEQSVPECVCETLCVEDSANADCAACAADIALCAGAPVKSPTVPQGGPVAITIDALADDADSIAVPYGTTQDGISFPALAANGSAFTLDGVAWKCETYGGNTPGDYVFTPVIPADKYSVDADAVLPTVIVTVLAEEIQENKSKAQDIIITAFAPLADDVANQSCPVDETLTVDDLNLPDTLDATDDKDGAATIEGVTWEPDKAFDAGEAEVFAFTATLPQGYTLTPGAELPQITVTVGGVATMAIQPMGTAQTAGDFTTLQSLLEDATTDYDITVTAPITLEGPIRIVAGRKHTISGDKLTRNAGHTGFLIDIPTTSSLELTNIVIDSANIAANTAMLIYGSLTMGEGAVIQNNISKEMDGGAVHVFADGVFTMNGGSIANNKATLGETGQNLNGGGVYVEQSSTFTMTNGTISGNSATGNGGGVINYGEFSITDGTISGNNAAAGGGVTNYGIFIMNGGDVSRNEATYNGGGVCNDGVFSMSSGTISGNTTGEKCHGGGVYVAQSGTFTMSDGTISGNTTGEDGHGGGVYNSGTFTIEGGEISGNTSAHGGGVYNRSVFTMSGGEISGNTSAYGGGAYNYSGTFTIEGGEISGNTATDHGGGAYNYNGTFTMGGGEISDNTATDHGGGVYNRSVFTMSGGEISDNTATYHGGGVYNRSVFTMSGGEISGNTSAYGGGAYNYSGTFTIEGGEISGNTATNYGGGVYNNSMFTMNDGTISGNTANRGGGVYAGSTSSTTLSGTANITENKATNPYETGKTFYCESGATFLNIDSVKAYNGIALAQGEPLLVIGALTDGARVVVDGVLRDDTITLQDGDVVARGENYQLTSQDVAHIEIAAAMPGYKLELKGNELVAVSTGGTGGGTSTDSNSGSTRTSPKTGDESDLSLYIALCMMAVVAILGVATYRRRKTNN